MSKAFDLASYDDVKAHAAIYDRIRGYVRRDTAAAKRRRSFGHKLRFSCSPNG